MSDKYVDPKKIGFINGLALMLNRSVSTSVNATEIVSNSTEILYIASDMGVTSFRSKHTVHHYVTLADEEDQLSELMISHPHLFPE